MRFAVHLSRIAVRNTCTKAMNIIPLTPGQILQGSRWNYRITDRVTGDNTHSSGVFKAKVVAANEQVDVSNAPEWAMIKKVLPDVEHAAENLDRERQNYLNLLPGIASSTCFRRLYDVIDGHTIALEWLDQTLADINYQPNAGIYDIIKAVLEAALTSCVFLDTHQYVNTDYKPANILLSSAQDGHITAKIGDLGLVVPAGHLVNAQPFAMRAPEVYLGQPCTSPSQVWAIAAMLFCWIKPGVLGAWDCPVPLINALWCMAKIKRLFPDWRIPTPDEVETHTLKAAVKNVVPLSETEEVFPAISPFGEEAQKVEMPEQLRDILRLMLVVNPAERPCASAVLASKEYRAFQTLSAAEH